MYKNILLPVLLGEDADNKASFAVAQRLASDGASFTILHAREPIPGYVAAQIPEDILANTQREVDEDMQKLAEQLPGAKTALMRGHAGRAILDYAEEHGIDCIVIASHQPGLEQFLLGSTANRVVHHATCSVHVIR